MLANNDVDGIAQLIRTIGEEYKSYLKDKTDELVESLRLVETEENRARAKLSSMIANMRSGYHYAFEEILDNLDEYLSARIKQAFCEDKIHGRPLH